MAVQAYILIQTEVGKAAAVAAAIAGLDGVAQAEDVTGPYDVIVRAEAHPSTSSASWSSPASRASTASPGP